MAMEGEVISDQEYITELKNEIARLQGTNDWSSSTALANLIKNPSALTQQFNLSPSQARNVASLITGGGAGLARKYLTDFVGAEMAGAIGGFLGAYVSRKLVGK